MARFALVIDGVFKETRNYPEQPEDIPHKKVVWLPYAEETEDNSTGPDTVKTVVSNVIEANRVVTTRTIRDKTQQELDDEKAAAQDVEFQKTQRTNSILKALATALFELINKDRADDGLSPITPAQFKTYLKGKM